MEPATIISVTAFFTDGPSKRFLLRGISDIRFQGEGVYLGFVEVVVKILILSLAVKTTKL